MVIYRLAVLNGNPAHLSTCSVRRYLTVSSRPEHIKGLADRLNGVVCGWRVQG